MPDLQFLKLGGSLITDKLSVETVRHELLMGLAEAIAAARQANPELTLVLGHGSGSFGHIPAARYGTREGVHNPEQWEGFARVAAAAARLNRLVVESLVAAGVPALSCSPSASATCEDGRLIDVSTSSIARALQVGLVPVVHGDVAFDQVRGGTIVSTEELFSFLAVEFTPSWLLLAGDMPGVLSFDGKPIADITPRTLPDVQPALGRSAGIDVTGGMASKVGGMLSLCQAHPGLRVRVFSGRDPDLLRRVLLGQAPAVGTVIRA